MENNNEKILGLIKELEKLIEKVDELIIDQNEMKSKEDNKTT